MRVGIADLSDLEDLHVLVVAFRDHLQRIHPDDASLRENLTCLIESGDAEFFLTFDDDGRPAGYVQQRYRHSIWLSGLEACLEDLFVNPSCRRQGVARGSFCLPFGGPVSWAADPSSWTRMNRIMPQSISIVDWGSHQGSTGYEDSRQLSLEMAIESTP